MITSTQQRNALLRRIEQLEKQLLAPPMPGMPNALIDAARAQIHDQISDLNAEIADFDLASNTEVSKLRVEIHSAEDLLKVPVMLRIASKQTQSRFAEAIGVSLSQLKRYEASGYREAPFSVLQGILLAFNIGLHGTAAQDANACEHLSPGH